MAETQKTETCRLANTVNFSNWVQFDDEDESEEFQIKKSQSWPMAAENSSEILNFSESFSSIGSEISFGSTSEKTEDDSRYSPLKEMQMKVLKENTEDGEDIEG